jgi:hypothetical protein
MHECKHRWHRQSLSSRKSSNTELSTSSTSRNHARASLGWKRARYSATFDLDAKQSGSQPACLPAPDVRAAADRSAVSQRLVSIARALTNLLLVIVIIRVHQADYAQWRHDGPRCAAPPTQGWLTLCLCSSHPRGLWVRADQASNGIT